MKTHVLAVTCLLATLVIGYAINPNPVLAAPSNLPAGFTATQLIDYNMIAPTGVKVAPDGRIFVFDLFGGIKIFTEGSGFNTTPFGSVAVDATGDRGLLGAVFDTDFANHPYVYLHYVGTDSRVRVGRFNASSSVGTNFTILYTAPLPSGYQHAGGGITMDGVGNIYFGIGDSGTPTNSQDMTSSHGKIHRIYRDGTIPTNPYWGQAGVASTTYAAGLRNPFRLTFDPVTNAVYVGDVGFNTWEEINLVLPGRNYGWATQEGPCTTTCAFENPRHWYAHQFGTNNTNDASILLGPVYRGTLYPTAYQGRMFYSDYVQGFLRTIDPATTSQSFDTVSTQNGSVIDMDVAPNGKLYFITISSPRLYRLDYTATGTVNQAPTAIATTTTTSGAAPLAVTFSSTGSFDPEGTPLTYLWDFGDGSSSTEANPTKIYPVTGQFNARLTVSDGVNQVQSSIITITVGNAPTLIINTPLASTTYRGGDTLAYSISGIDTNGNPLASTSLTTTIRLHHSDHSHPFAGPFVGTTGTVTAPVDGELSPDVWLRFTFEAIGQNGVRTTRDVDVYPQLSQITVTTFPAGLNVILDGSNHVIPPTVQGVIGMNRQIAAPSPQVFGGKQYVFDYWSDGGTRDHTFSFPATTSVYTAYFREATTTAYTNLVENGSFENNGAFPYNWSFSRWGANNITGTIVPDARTGVYSAQLAGAPVASGDGRLFHAPVPITPGTVYGVQYYRKNTVPFKVVADVTLQDNTHNYIWLGISQPATAWTEQNWSFTAPANSKNVVVNLYLTTDGTMQIDDFSLFDPTGTTTVPVVPPPVATTTIPVITFSASPSAIPFGATTTLSWSATGTTCVASNGWSGTQSASGTTTVSPAATTTYTLTCANSAGTSTQSVTVAVAPIVITPPSVANLITNPSVEEHDAQDRPIGFVATRWGTNDGVMDHAHGGAYDGSHSLAATITTHTTGEAGWITVPITVAPATKYIFSQFAQSAGVTKVLVEITTTAGAKRYVWLGRLPVTTTWTAFTKSFTTPADAASIKIGTYMTGVGNFAIDQISLTADQSTIPPTATFTSDVSTLPAGGGLVTLNVTYTGENVTCTVTSGWTGTITPGVSQVVPITQTTTFTVVCQNAYGTDTKSVTVVVEPTTPPPPPPPAPTGNLITPNTTWNGSDPSGWIKGSWGTNTTTFTTATSGRTDSSSLQVTMADYTNGDAKWFFTPVAVATSTTYTYSHWYQSDVDTSLVLEYTLIGGSKTYEWLGSVPASATWNEKSLTLITPTDAAKLTIHHVLKANGTLTTDDYSLTAN